MVTINNEDLRNVYHYLVTIENTVQKEIRHVRGNKTHLDKMVPEQLSKVYSTKEKTALAFIDSLIIKSTINTHSKKPLNYFDSKERFVNDQIDRLSGILFLIENIIDSDLFNKLKIVKDHRNYIAHGKRDSLPPADEYPIDIIAKVLDDVISEIEK